MEVSITYLTCNIRSQSASYGIVGESLVHAVSIETEHTTIAFEENFFGHVERNSINIY